MRTKMDYSSLGESKSTFSNTPTAASSTYSHVGRETSGNVTHSSVRGQKQSDVQQRTVYSSGSSWAGAKRQEDNSSTLGVAMGLLAGASVGVLAGILMAPDSGRITRRRLSDSAAWVGRGINEKLNFNKGKTNSWMENAEKTVQEAADTVKKKVSDTGREL